MERDYNFSPELLQMMLSEERQRFVSGIDNGASWGELHRIRKTINEINNLLDSSKTIHSHLRSNEKGPR